MKLFYSLIVCLMILTGICAGQETGQIRIPINLDIPGFVPESAWPMSVSIPLPAGKVSAAEDVVLVDEDGQLIACQKEVLATWTPDGDIKWLEMNFSWEPNKTYSALLHSGKVTPRSSGAIEVTRKGGAVELDMGQMEATVTSEGALQIKIGSKIILDAPDGFIYFVDNNGKEFRSAGADAQIEMIVETEGPQTTTVRLEGWYVDGQGQKSARQITRLQFFRGQSLVKIIHTFVITEDTNNRWFGDIGLEFPLKLDGPITGIADKSYLFDGEAVTTPIAAGQAMSLFQEVYKHHGEEAMRGVVGIVEDGTMDELAKADRVGEWASVGGKGHRVTAVLRDFWQTFPKEIEVSGDEMRVHLFSGRGGRELDFRPQTMAKYWGKWASLFVEDKGFLFELAEKPANAAGLARTHEIWLMFHPADTPVEAIARAAHVVSEPILALPDPKWSCATGIFGPMSPYDLDKFPKEEAFISQCYDWFIGFGERFGHWGFLEYGVVHAFNYGRGDAGSNRMRITDDKKWRAGFRRYGREKYGFIRNNWNLYIRSGDRKYYEVGRIASNHFMDIRMVHWDLPQKFRGAYATGKWENGYWHTPIFWGSDEPDPLVQTYGTFNMDTSNNLLPYYITGQRRAKDALNERIDGVKKTWDWKTVEFHEERSKTAMLANLARLYTFSWDKKLLEFMELLGPHIIDRDSPYGLRSRIMYNSYGMPRIPAASHYLNRKAAWVMEYAELMQSPQDREAALRAIRYAYEIDEGGGSYDGMGKDYSSYYLATGNTDMLWRLRRHIDDLLHLYWNEDKNEFDGAWKEESGRWGFISGGACSVMSTIPYALTSLGMEPELAKERETIMAREAHGDTSGVATSPLYVKLPFGETTKLEFFSGGEMAWGSGAPMTVRSSRKSTQGAVWIDTHSTITQPGTNPYYHNYYHRVTFGPGEPPVPLDQVGTDKPAQWYCLTPGYGSTYRAVGPANIPAVVLVPAEGFIVGRALYKARWPRDKWFFQVPTGASSFEFKSDGPIRITGPDETVIVDYDDFDKGSVVQVPSGTDGKVWGFQPRHNLTRIEMIGIPPFLAYGRAERFFLPVGWEKEAAVEWPKAAPEAAAFWQGVSGRLGDQGLYLGQGAHLAVDLDDSAKNALADSGTIEMWFRPNFNSESLSQSGYTPFVSSADGESLAFYANWHKGSHKYKSWGRHLNATIQKDKDTYNSKRIEMMFAAGKWTHLAVTWQIEGGKTNLAFYVNGIKYKTRNGGKWKPGLSLDLGSGLTFGRFGPRADALNGVLDEIRISDTMRYKDDFIPQTKPLVPDENTIVLYHLDGDTKGVGKGSEHMEAQIQIETE